MEHLRVEYGIVRLLGSSSLGFFFAAMFTFAIYKSVWPSRGVLIVLVGTTPPLTRAILWGWERTRKVSDDERRKWYRATSRKL